MPWFAYLFHNCSLPCCLASSALLPMFCGYKVSFLDWKTSKSKPYTYTVIIPYGAEYNG